MIGFEELKKRKLFSAGDLFFYFALALLIVFLLIYFAFPKSEEEFTGVEIRLDNESVYTYRFGEGGKIAAGCESVVRETTELGVVFVRVTTADGFNLIAIDDAARSVRMENADCSFKRDCTHMNPVESESGVIVCLPHKLKILSLSPEENLLPTIG